MLSGMGIYGLLNTKYGDSPQAFLEAPSSPARREKHFSGTR